MCAVFGITGLTSVNQQIYDALLLMQHRGQDAAGIVTASEKKISICRGVGLVRDVFRTRDMRNLVGNMGIGHCRYPKRVMLETPGGSTILCQCPFWYCSSHNSNLQMRYHKMNVSKGQKAY